MLDRLDFQALSLRLNASQRQAPRDILNCFTTVATRGGASTYLWTLFVTVTFHLQLTAPAAALRPARQDLFHLVRSAVLPALNSETSESIPMQREQEKSQIRNVTTTLVQPAPRCFLGEEPCKRSKTFLNLRSFIEINFFDAVNRLDLIVDTTRCFSQRWFPFPMNLDVPSDCK